VNAMGLKDPYEKSRLESALEALAEALEEDVR